MNKRWIGGVPGQITSVYPEVGELAFKIAEKLRMDNFTFKLV